ncbi:MAG: ATP-binding protein [Candidatus Omnitrophica bacterium]|nr:ATP-binding protein [Candidatus Omnitrophota bacterium]
MANLQLNQVQGNLEKLTLNRMSEILPDYLKTAADRNLPHLEFIEGLAEEEIAFKTEKTIKYKLKRAKFPQVKTLDTFDFSFQTSISKKKILELANLSFIDRKENVIFLGPPGVGKTHLAISLGVKACENKYPVIFYTANDLIQQLTSSLADRTLDKELKRLLYCPLIIVDEIGYLPIDNLGASLFFQFITSRYEKGAIILSSNKSFSNWGQIFADGILASAILDRLLHHANVINIKGESYRLKDRKKELLNQEKE